jgi:hypothetical protein
MSTPTLHRVKPGHYEFTHDGERHTVTHGGTEDNLFLGWNVHRLGVAYVSTHRTLEDVRVAFSDDDNRPGFAEGIDTAYGEWMASGRD